MVGLIPYDNDSLKKKLAKVRPGEVVDLRYSDLRMVDMSHHDIRGMMKSLTSHALTADPGDAIFLDLTKSNISGRDFSNYNLTHVIMTGVIAQHTVFTGSDMTDTKIDEADISFSDCRNVTMHFTKLYNTNIEGVNFSYADLEHAYGLDLRSPGKKTVERLSCAANISHAILPKKAEPFRKMIESSIHNRTVRQKNHTRIAKLTGKAKKK